MENPAARLWRVTIGSSAPACGKQPLPVSGVTAKNVNIHLIGATSAGSPPAACTGKTENTVNDFGANGILGVGPFVNDCNSSGDCMPDLPFDGSWIGGVEAPPASRSKRDAASCPRAGGEEKIFPTVRGVFLGSCL